MYKLKTQEELKEYLENLGIEYRFGCYSEKNPDVCHLLGEWLDIIKSDFNKAGKIFKTNCDDSNYARSCHAYGNYVLLGKGQEKKNLETAYNYYLKACELNYNTSCFNAGIMTISGDSSSKREKDYTKGIQLLDKGCNLAHMNSCYYLSGVYIKGLHEIQEKDMKKAAKYSEKACELGNINACLNLSVMYRKGDGVDKDDKMSEKYKTRADQLRAEIDTSVQKDSTFFLD